ncbi:MAG: hypothetical protein M9962_09245 [Oligoflexia bacterium]|nr:hypothetical protein [Oligoflexia bacterium]
MSPGKLFKKYFFLTAFAFFYAANFFSSFANANGCAKHNVANQDISKHAPTCLASVKEIATSEEAIKKLIEETKTANANKVISLPPGEVNPTIILEAKKTLERAAALHASVAEKAKKSGEALVAAIGKSKTAMRDMGTKRSEHLRKIESELKPKAQMLTIEWQSYKDRLRKQELERNEPYYKYRKDEVEARIQGVANRMKDYASQITDTNREIQKIQGWIKELEGAIGDHSVLSRQAEGRNFPALKRIYSDNNEAAKKVAEMAAKLNPSSLKTAEDVQKVIDEPQAESTISGVTKKGEEDPLSGYGAWGEQVREGRDSVERGNTIKAESPEEESFVGQVIRQAEADSEDGLARVRADTETLGGPEGVRKEYEGWLTELNAKKSAIGEGTFISEGEERDAVRIESARKAADEYNEIYYKGTQNLALAQLAAEDGIKPVNTGALSEVIEMPVTDGVHAVTNEKYVSISGNTGNVGSALETAANPDFAKEIIRKQAAMDVTVANQYAANAEKYAKVQNAPTLFGENVSFADRLRVIGGTDFKDANSRFIIEENRFAAGVVASGNEGNTKQVQDALWEARARLIPETGVSLVPLLGSKLDVDINENWEGTTKVNALQSGFNSSYTGQMDDAWLGTKMSYGGAAVDVLTLGVGKKVVMAEKGIAASVGADVVESAAPRFSAQLVDTYNMRLLTEPVTVKYTSPVIDNGVRVADDVPVTTKISNSYEATPEQLAAGQARRGPTADQYNSYALEQQQIVAGNARRGATADEIKSFQTEQQQIIAGQARRGPTADQYNSYVLEQRQITAGQASRGATADEYNSHVTLQKQIEAGKNQNGAGFGERAAYQAELDRKALETKRIETEGRRSGESFGERQRYIDEQAAEAKRIADEAAAAERRQIDEYKSLGNTRSVSNADKKLADQAEADRLAEEARLQARIDADNARKARLEAEATRRAEQLAKERAIESARIHDELLAKQAKELEEARIAKERSDAIVRTEEANREAARKRVLAAKKQAEIEEARKAEELAEAQAKAARERAAEGARIHDELLAKQAKELEEARLAAKRDEAIVATEKANREAAARRAQELAEQARRARGITIDEGTRSARAAEVRAITIDKRAEDIADTVRAREIGEVVTRQADNRRFIDEAANDNVNPARATELEQERLARELTRQKKAQEAAEAAAREKELAYQNELRLLREKQLFQEEELRKLRLAKAEKEAAEAVRLEALAKARKAEDDLRAARLAAQRTAARNSKVAEEAAARRTAQNERLVANGNAVNTTSTAEVTNAVGGIISGVANAVNAQKRAGSSVGGLTQQVYKNAEAAPNVVRMSPKAQTSRFGSVPSILPDNVADDFVEQANKAVDLPSGGNRYQASSTLPNDSARRTSRNAANSNSGANQYNPGRLGYSGSTLDDSATVASDAKATNIRQGSQGQRTVAARSAADQARKKMFMILQKRDQVIEVELHNLGLLMNVHRFVLQNQVGEGQHQLLIL